VQAQRAAATGSVQPSSAGRSSSGIGTGRSSSGTGYAAVSKEEAAHVQIAVGEADTVRLVAGEPSVQVRGVQL
jgi:hypothetical protein